MEIIHILHPVPSEILNLVWWASGAVLIFLEGRGTVHLGSRSFQRVRRAFVTMASAGMRRERPESTAVGSRRTTAKAFAKDVFINQERKLGARRRSDTVLVSTINDADQGSADVTFRTPLAPYEKSKSLGSGGSMVARLKLKGIDGRAPPGVEPAA
ncbi:hypothetical protein LWI29_024569 [Acer saccharum]|uniref:Uncharacterized protein n=1 Tax=Acer saccharum TaxID=4024 RepID=A0AA39VVT7_ACESA|nr:hypothetical protein LWI29_024569 [Acer saccharum]